MIDLSVYNLKVLVTTDFPDPVHSLCEHITAEVGGDRHHHSLIMPAPLIAGHGSGTYAECTALCNNLQVLKGSLTVVSGKYVDVLLP